MLHGSFLADVLTLLLAAVLVVSIFRFFKISPILGYLMVGLLIGPYALNLLSNVENASMLGEFGVVFLLFTLGLKMPLQRLQVLRRYVFGLGLAQVAITAGVICAIVLLCQLSFETALLIGSALALSSTAVSMQILTERGEFALRHGRVSFAVLLFQDLAVIILIALVSTLGKDQASLSVELGVAGVKAFVALLLITLLGRLIFRPLYRGIAQLASPELFVAVTLLVVLTTGAITASFGLSMELGAFLAGLLLSETEYRHQVEADIQPFYGLLLGLFFISVGMTIDLRFVAASLPLVLGSLARGQDASPLPLVSGIFLATRLGHTCGPFTLDGGGVRFCASAPRHQRRPHSRRHRTTSLRGCGHFHGSHACLGKLRQIHDKPVARTRSRSKPSVREVRDY